MDNYEFRKANYALQEYLLDYMPQEARHYSEEYSEDGVEEINPREIATKNLEPGAYKNLRILEDFFYFYTNKLAFNLTLEPIDVRAVIDANNIKWEPSDAQCIDILEVAYKRTDEVGLSESVILWAVEEQLEELNVEAPLPYSPIDVLTW